MLARSMSFDEAAQSAQILPSLTVCCVVVLSCRSPTRGAQPRSAAVQQPINTTSLSPDRPDAFANGDTVAVLEVAANANTEAGVANRCDFHAAVALRLRTTMYEDHPTTVIPAGTALELLAVRDDARRTLDRVGVLCRVRIRSTGAEGSVYLSADEVAACQESQPLAPNIRESHRVMVDGVEEEWRVRFETSSRPSEEQDDEGGTCLDAFARRHDERPAVIERLRNGVVVDSLRNACMSGDSGGGCFPHLLIPRRVQSTMRQPSPTPAQLERTPWITVLDIGDYNHDGRAWEFALNIGYLICGHPVSAVIGITRDQPRLHTLRWADNQPMALINDLRQWDAVRAHPRGEMVIWGCWDHGYGAEKRLRWHPARGRLAGTYFDLAMDDDCHHIFGPNGRVELPATEAEE